ncbi:glycosyltransferase family 4 protein [Enterobacter soli]|nr:glycosyltransferase family 4 protein [Enterobacter soli]
MKHNILIVCRSLPIHALGGMELITFDLMVELAKNINNKVTVLTTDVKQDFKKQYKNIDIRYVEGSPSGKYSRFWWEKSPEIAKKIILEKNINSVISVSSGAYKIIKLKKEFPHINFIFQAHGTSLGEILSKFRSKNIKSIIGSARNFSWIVKDILSYNRFDKIVAVGDHVHQQLTSGILSLFYDKGKCVCINNGVDDVLFGYDENKRYLKRYKHNISKSTTVFISVSRLHKQKGVLNAVKLFEEYRKENNDSILLILGDGPHRKEINNYISSLGIADSVLLIGGKDRGEISEYLSSADCFLFLSNRVEVGLTLNMLEALTAGLPIVVGEKFKTIINNPEVLGCVVYSTDISEIKNKVDERRENRNSFGSEYSLKSMAQKYQALLDGNKSVVS